jgi:hypothetical protein
MYYPTGFAMRLPKIAVLCALLLVGCVTDKDKGLCPDAAVLATTSALTVFRNGAPADATGELFTAWMVDVASGCDFSKDDKSTDSHLTIKFTATRPNGGEAAFYKIPYYVVVTQGGSRIMTKQMFLAHFAFQAGETKVNFEEKVQSVVIKLADRDSKVGSFEILTGLQLTKSQVDYNKKMGHFAP